jgi:hypothetical protein
MNASWERCMVADQAISASLNVHNQGKEKFFWQMSQRLMMTQEIHLQKNAKSLCLANERHPKKGEQSNGIVNCGSFVLTSQKTRRKICKMQLQ